MKYQKKKIKTSNQTNKQKTGKNRKYNKDQETSTNVKIISSENYKMMLHSQNKDRMLQKVNHNSTKMGFWLLKVHEN